MSAFVCILDRSGGELDPGEIQRLAKPLADYGAALSSFSQGPVAIAVRHPADLPDRRRHGPLADPERDLVAAVAGRFHPVPASPPRGAADGRTAAPACAAIALAALRQPEAGFPAAVAGSFVIIAASPQGRWLSLARDHLGDLKVYYYLDRRWLIAASEPAAILRHGAVAAELDEVTAARFLGFRFSHSERSFFCQIRELPPAHRLRVTAGDCRSEQYWRFRLRGDGRKLSPERIQAGFVGHLERSVADQLTGLEPGQLALSLSGGLDSTALAVLAPRGVQAFSWYFEEARECDERRNIEAVTRHLGRRTRWVQGDGLYPLCGDYVDRFVHPNSPHLNAFAALKDSLYRAARAEGCRRVLVGDSGDALYTASEYWLRDALTDGRPGTLASLLRTLRAAARGERLARLALRRLLPIRNVRAAVGGGSPPWLTGLARSYLPPKRPSPILPETRRSRRYELTVGAKHTELESEERRLFARCGIGRGNPFWYWPLLETVIDLPAYWYHHDGTAKVLTRQALRGMLPAAVLDSGSVGQLGGFFLRGIAAQRRELRTTVFRRPRSDWQRYVRQAWLEPYLEATGSIRFGHTILWRVIGYELWCRRLLRR